MNPRQRIGMGMKILVTGSAGHLGEALVRTLQNTQHDVVGIDLIKTDFTRTIGSIWGL
ncbi:NAD-dependent epimerase/dehydratase family protein [Phormidesmis sp. 146-35]